MALQVDAASKQAMAKLFADLSKVAPDVAKETRKRFRQAAQPVLADARRRQKKRSGTLRRTTRISISRGMTQIRSSAPHARISEFGGRHPLWGDRDRWVPQPANPAIWPAVQAGREEFLRAADNAVHQACRKAGFK